MPNHADLTAPRLFTSRRKWLLCFLLLLIFSGWLRVANFRSIIVEGEVIPLGVDAFYHMRRTLLTADSFPDVPVFDPLINWPKGGSGHWAPGLDQLGAAMVILVGSSNGDNLALTLLCLLPCIFGLFIVWTTVAIVLRLLAGEADRNWIALAAGFIVAILPIAIQSSKFGRLDHHVCETLSMALLGYWALSRFPLAEFAQRSMKSRLWFEVSGALFAAISLYFFVGSVIYVAIATTILIGASLTTRATNRTTLTTLLGSGAPALVAAGLLCALFYAPAVNEHGRVFSIVFPSWMQPLLIVFAGISCAAAALISSLMPMTSPGAGPVFRRFVIWSVAMVLVIVAVGVAIPAARTTFFSAVSGSRTGHSDPCISKIDEFRSLNLGHSYFSAAGWKRIVTFYGTLGFAAPLLIILGLRRGLNRSGRGASWMLWTLAILVLTLWQSRFGRIMTVNLAVCAALALHVLVSGLVRMGRLRGRLASPSLIAAVCLALLFGLDSRFSSAMIPAPGRKLFPLEAAALYLRSTISKPTAGQAKMHSRLRNNMPTPGNGAGVLTSWDWGHQVLYLSGLPVVATGFCNNLDEEGLEAVNNSMLTGERNLVSTMRRYDLGWIIQGAGHILNTLPARNRQPALTRISDSMGAVNVAYLKDRPLGTLMMGGSGVPSAGVPHVAQLSPRWASQQTVDGLGFPMPILWVYQLVKGAKIVGHTTPGHRVIAYNQLGLRGGSQTYMAWTSADAQGRFTLTLALPSGLRLKTLITGSAWKIVLENKRVVRVRVSNQAVLSGETISLK